MEEESKAPAAPAVIASPAATVIASPAVPIHAAARLSAPMDWAKAKKTADWILSGAYFAHKWERDSSGNDLSLVSELDYDAACVAVASISINSAPHPRKG